MERGNACKSCSLEIVDGQAYKLGQDQWHVACFACSKCQKALGVNSNFLVLGTGALVCSDCSYSCKSCNKKIYDLAILTGDQAYCSDCFKCKSCKKPIDDLKYARTSKGLFCMPCHHMLMEKKKKYELMKLKKDVKKAVDDNKVLSIENKLNDNDSEKKIQINNEKDIDVTANIPKLADSTTSSVDPKLFTTQNNNNSSSLSTFDISDYANDKSRISSYGSSLLNSDPLDSDDPISEITPKAIQNSNQISTPREIVPNTPRADNDQILPSRSPLRTTMTPITKSTSQYRTPELSTPARKDSKTSQFYRNGYVLEETINKDLDISSEAEPESFINLDDETEEESLMETTLMSPIKSGSNKILTENETNSSDDHITSDNFKFGGDLPASENSFIESTPKQQQHQYKSQQTQTQTQTPTHQRNVSGTDTIVEKKFGLGRSLTKVFKTRKSSGQDEIPIHSRTRSDHSTSHFRTVSDHSFHSNIVSPLLRNDSQFTGQHSRSTSENHHNQQQQFLETELNNLKYEINSLTISKASILKEIQNLQLQKKQLEFDVNEREKKLKDLDTSISKHSFNSINQSVDSLSKNDHISIISSQGGGTTSQDDETFDQQFAVPALPSSSNSKKGGSGSGGGFMRRFFGSSSNTPNGTIPNSNGSISQPMNPVHGDEAIKAMKNSISYHENLSQQGFSSQIKSSRSTNFLKIGGVGNNGTVNKELRIYSMTIEELSNFENRSIPFIIETCINEVKEKGLRQEGIYRISASTSTVEKLEQYFDKLNLNDTKSLNSILEIDINAVSGLLKRYLKKIPDSLIPASEYNRYVLIGNIKSDASKINMLKDMIDRIPKSNKLVMYLLANHLNEISSNEQWNKMNLKSLATVFAPTLIRDESLNPHQEIQDNKLKTEVTEFLFMNYKFIFQGIV